MFQKITLVLLAAAVLAAGIYFNSPSQVSAEDEKLHLSLDDAVEMALKENAEVYLAKIGLEKAETSLREVRRRSQNLQDARDQGDSFRDLGMTSYEYALATRVEPQSAEMDLVLAESGLEGIKDSIKISVESAYYDVLKARADLENAEDAVKRAEERLRLAEVNYQAGTAARLEVINAEVSLAVERSVRSKAQNAYEKSIMDFNNTAGLPLNEKINLTSSFKFEPKEIDLAKTVERAKKVNTEYIAAQEETIVAEKIFEAADSHYTPNVFAYRQAEYDREKAKINADQTKKDLILDVKKAYLNFKSAEERYKTVKESMKQAEESYLLTKYRYEVGMSTQLELEEAGGNLDRSKAELSKALYDYNLMKAQLDLGIFK